MTFISKEVRYPTLAKENGVDGTAVISFVVEKDGSLSDIQLVRDPGAGLGAEAERVIQLLAQKGKRWEPGQQRGRNVRVQFNIPIKFRLD
jgi:protein TonB